MGKSVTLRGSVAALEPPKLQSVAESWREARRLRWAVYDFPVSLQGIRKHALMGKGVFIFGN